MIMQSIKNPDDYALYILNTTDDILIVEKLFEVTNYVIPRGLNACLSTITNMNVIRYITSHTYARFNVAYKTYEPLRLAVLNGDLERIRA